jgi:hypothetical protein
MSPLGLVGIMCAFLLAVVALGIWLDAKNTRKHNEAEELRKDKFLAEESAKPRYVVLFKTEAGDHQTNALEPDAHCFWRGYCLRTSKDRAESCLVSFFKNQRFIDDRNVSYPACGVKSAHTSEVVRDNGGMGWD